ncbi:hypothetical protein [Halorussus sp. MSC15.2]|uniref:hypothetical protein n=1 Tax=Halorussus sp. MSC15.2 TaxID=2283638 RepID=UPI0013D54F7F|nr:hypothetical protein [Halorussus sp. MSC15.2]NEU58602.1 hypothetical protein [Halorussus sp. MSC15.2]
MTQLDASKVLERAESERKHVRSLLRDAATVFHEREGELFPRSDAVSLLAEELDVTRDTADRAVSGLVGDTVDPVVQLSADGEHTVGVIDYHEHEFWYGYTDYHDVFGRRKKGVCGQCVREAATDNEVTYVAEGEGRLTDGASWDDIEAQLTTHFERAHPGVEAVDVQTGATLASGSTIAGNAIIHAGNASSKANADMVDGMHASDLAPTHDDGSTKCHIVATERFGAEGSSTTNTSYATIAGSDLTFNPDDYRDADGNLYCRFYAHLKHGNNSGTTYARMYRQNAASAVSGTQVSVSASDGWGKGDSGWVNFGDSGYESYHVQLKSSDGEPVSYNSIILQLGVPA